VCLSCLTLSQNTWQFIVTFTLLQTYRKLCATIAAWCWNRATEVGGLRITFWYTLCRWVVVGGPPFPPIDSVWALVLVWRIRAKIIRTALCCVVYNSCTQWHNTHTHTCEQFLHFCMLVGFRFFLCVYLGFVFCVFFHVSLGHLACTACMPPGL